MVMMVVMNAHRHIPEAGIFMRSFPSKALDADCPAMQVTITMKGNGPVAITTIIQPDFKVQ
jgi:hypothetical protein